MLRLVKTNKNFLKKTELKAGLNSSGNKRLTQTSAHKHLCQTLSKINISKEQVVRWTDHKNTQCLDNYKRMRNDMQNQVSILLCGVKNIDVNSRIEHVIFSKSNSTRQQQFKNVVCSALKPVFDGPNI